MNITDIKNDLHQLVVETDDIDVLKAIQQVFKAMQKQKTDWWDLLSKPEQQLVQKSIQQANEGQLIPTTEVHAKINAWIKAKS